MRTIPSRQVAMAAVLAVATAVGFFCATGWRAQGAANDPSAPAAPQSGVFRPTKEEWAGLHVERVASRVFRPEEIAEGNIAVDDDLTTPVFSPYSGRVTRVIA